MFSKQSQEQVEATAFIRNNYELASIHIQLSNTHSGFTKISEALNSTDSRSYFVHVDYLDRLLFTLRRIHYLR